MVFLITDAHTYLKNCKNRLNLIAAIVLYPWDGIVLYYSAYDVQSHNYCKFSKCDCYVEPMTWGTLSVIRDCAITLQYFNMCAGGSTWSWGSRVDLFEYMGELFTLGSVELNREHVCLANRVTVVKTVLFCKLKKFLLVKEAQLNWFR